MNSKFPPTTTVATLAGRTPSGRSISSVPGPLTTKSDPSPRDWSCATVACGKVRLPLSAIAFKLDGPRRCDRGRRARVFGSDGPAKYDVVAGRTDTFLPEIHRLTSVIDPSWLVTPASAMLDRMVPERAERRIVGRVDVAVRDANPESAGVGQLAFQIPADRRGKLLRCSS